MRKPIIAGNWKMNKTVAEAETLVAGIIQALEGQTAVEVVCCPPATALATAGKAMEGSSLYLGAQNMHWEASGAFTGEVSPTMLKELYCRYVIIGHSERRTIFGETDEEVNKKVKAARAAGLRAIVCVGETLDERENGTTTEVVERQITGAYADIAEAEVAETVVAYEPVWAIGTGKTATPEMAQEVHATIRAKLASLYSEDTAAKVRIQYGGSMKPANAAELLSQPDIDGGLIGGAALDARSFVDIVLAAG
jgi:triosephosphate isomerase